MKIRERKLNFNENLYGSIFKCMNNSSYQDVSSQINLDIISKTAFIPNKYFLDINNKIVEYIFKINNKPHIYGYLNLLINMVQIIKHNIKELLVVYMTLIIIKKRDEREQIKYLKPNHIIIFDRGYFIHMIL